MAGRPEHAPGRTGDAIVALATFGVMLGAAAIRPAGTQPGVALVAVVAALGPCIALFYRRRWPVAVFAFALTAWLGASLAGEKLPGMVPVAVALYAVALVGGRAPTLVAWGVATFAATVQGLPFAGPPASALEALPYGLLVGSALGAVGFYGLYQATRRVYVSALEERAAQLERERELDARAAVAEERTRISRELHDVVAHHVSVMVIQAGAAEAVLPGGAADARAALESIRSTGREALSEMRDMVHVLRHEGGSGADSTARTPEPGLAELEALACRLRDAGLDVEVDRLDGPLAIPVTLDQSAYRIVQEALTNVLRHAGPGARARVAIQVEGEDLVVEVTDDGRGPASAEPGAPAARPGHGLTVMRERVGMFGGEVSTGAGPTGGFRVAARLPLSAANGSVDQAGDDAPRSLRQGSAAAP